MVEILAATSWRPRNFQCGLGESGGMMDLVAPVSTRNVVDGAATIVGGRCLRFFGQVQPSWHFLAAAPKVV